MKASCTASGNISWQSHSGTVWRFLKNQKQDDHMFSAKLIQSCSYSSQPCGLQPVRFLCPWDFPGKNIGVGCHALLQGNLLRDQTHISYVFCNGRQVLYHYHLPMKPLKWIRYLQLFQVQFSSVAQQCLTLCNPKKCSTPGFPAHHQLPELTQTHVH